MAKILVVEDDDDIRLITTMTLERAGHDVIAVATGAEAAEHFTTVEVIVTDMSLPDLDGFGVLDILPEPWPVPVIVMSAHPAMDWRPLLLERGAYAYLAKPFDGSDLIAMVDEAVTGR